MLPCCCWCAFRFCSMSWAPVSLLLQLLLQWFQILQHVFIALVFMSLLQSFQTVVYALVFMLLLQWFQILQHVFIALIFILLFQWFQILQHVFIALIFILLLQWFQILQHVFIALIFHVAVSRVLHCGVCLGPLFSCYCFSGFRLCRVFWSPVFMLLFQWFQIMVYILIPSFHVTVSMVSDSAVCLDPLFPCILRARRRRSSRGRTTGSRTGQRRQRHQSLHQPHHRPWQSLWHLGRRSHSAAAVLIPARGAGLVPHPRCCQQVRAFVKALHCCWWQGDSHLICGIFLKALLLMARNSKPP